MDGKTDVGAAPAARDQDVRVGEGRIGTRDEIPLDGTAYREGGDVLGTFPEFPQGERRGRGIRIDGKGTRKTTEVHEKAGRPIVGLPRGVDGRGEKIELVHRGFLKAGLPNVRRLDDGDMGHDRKDREDDDELDQGKSDAPVFSEFFHD